MNLEERSARSPGPYLELFACGKGEGWDQWGNEVDGYFPSCPTYKNPRQKIIPLGNRPKAHKGTPQRQIRSSAGWQASFVVTP